jgi:AraC family L-rhamnose operon transcriptional activator RhaR
MKQRVESLKGERFFSEAFPLYVNRSEESFEAAYHNHDFFEIAYVSEGRGFHYIDGRMVPVIKGELYVLPVGVPHVFRPPSARKGGLVVYNCVFRERLVMTLADAFRTPEIRELVEPKCRPEWFVLRERHGEFERLFKELHYENRSGALAGTAMQLSLLVQLLVRIVRSRASGIASKGGIRSLEPVLNRIHHRLDGSITLKDLAAQYRISGRQLQRLFKAQTGQTFTQYLRQARIARSRQLLQTTDMTVGQIAEAVGYRDHDTFYRHFKRIAGCTPNVYRKNALTAGGQQGDEP